MGSGCLDAKFGDIKNIKGCKCNIPFRHWNYMSACFQAPWNCTQTMTDGNALCLLIKSFILQHIALTRSLMHGVNYKNK